MRLVDAVIATVVVCIRCEGGEESRIISVDKMGWGKKLQLEGRENLKWGGDVTDHFQLNRLKGELGFLIE